MIDMIMYDEYTCLNEPMLLHQNVKPNIRTGEGRRVKLRLGSKKLADLKKKQHRKMSKKSKRQNRRS